MDQFSLATYHTLIDHFLVTNGILAKFGDGNEKRLARPVSDHYPLHLWGENMWLNSKDFLPFLQRWSVANPIIGWPGHGFINKLKLLKVALKEWNVNSIVNIAMTKTLLQSELVVIDSAIEEENQSQENISKINYIKEQLLSIITFEEIKWRKNCKFKWHIEGDENTSFFHTYAAAKKRKNCITEVLNDQQINLIHDSDIENKILNFYKNLYSKDSKDRFIPSSMDWSPINDQ